MLVRLEIPIDRIHVPVKRRKTLDFERMNNLAMSILEDGQKTPVRLRQEKTSGGFVLLEGLHRLEAMKALGETRIEGYLVQGRLH